MSLPLSERPPSVPDEKVSPLDCLLSEGCSCPLFVDFEPKLNSEVEFEVPTVLVFPVVVVVPVEVSFEPVERPNETTGFDDVVLSSGLFRVNVKGDFLTVLVTSVPDLALFENSNSGFFSA